MFAKQSNKDFQLELFGCTFQRLWVRVVKLSIIQLRSLICSELIEELLTKTHKGNSRRKKSLK